MKYFNVQGINRAISLIRDGNNTQEHVTSRATSAMLEHYFKQGENWFIVPEQIQLVSNKHPDYVVEKFIEAINNFKPHLFVEVKSLINKDIGSILDQLYDTVIYAVDMNVDSLSCFMIAMKGTKIAFYTFHNFSSLLDDNGVLHYKGFIPLNYEIPITPYSNINDMVGPQVWEDYVNSRGSFTVDPNVLNGMGALKTKGLNHPHILDLVNELHKDDIHNMWKHVVEKSSNIFPN